MEGDGGQTKQLPISRWQRSGIISSGPHLPGPHLPSYFATAWIWLTRNRRQNPPASASLQAHTLLIRCYKRSRTSHSENPSTTLCRDNDAILSDTLFVWPASSASSGPHLPARIFGDKFASPITFVSLRGWISQREYANTAFPPFRKKTCAQLPAET
jgi:hypothetical protein